MMRIPSAVALSFFLFAGGLSSVISLAAQADTAAPQSPPAPAPAKATPTSAKRETPDLARERHEPIHVSADSIEINQRKGVAYYRGHVVFVQGGLRITASRATAHMRNNAIQTVTAEGNPLTIFQSAPAPEQVVRGSAAHMEYNAFKQLLSLYGDVAFEQGSDSLHSGTLHYDIATGTVTAEASSAQDQVHVVIQPTRVPGVPTEPGSAKPGVTK